MKRCCIVCMAYAPRHCTTCHEPEDFEVVLPPAEENIDVPGRMRGKDNE